MSQQLNLRMGMNSEGRGHTTLRAPHSKKWGTKTPYPAVSWSMLALPNCSS